MAGARGESESKSESKSDASDAYYVLAELFQGNSTAAYSVIDLNPIKMISGPDESLAGRLV